MESRTYASYDCCEIRFRLKGADAKKRTFTAAIVHEEPWYVAQCLEVDVAGQGESPDEALANLREALELYFDDPQPTIEPCIERFEIETRAA